MLTIIAMVIAYLIGSVSSAVLVCKFFKQPDPRAKGSQNPGATNVLRIAGKKPALVTLGLDILKGVVAVLIGRILAQHGLELGVIAVAVVVGHMYPIFFKFKGGKGVATSLGAIIVISPLLALASAVTWLVIAAIFRYSSLAALISAVLVPFYAFFLAKPIYFLALLPITVLLIWRHRENIIRLRNRTETKINFK